MPVYSRADIQFERGQGAYLFDTEGRKYLDFASGIAVTSLGHCHPTLVAALTEQGNKLWHTSNLFRVPGQEKLAARLTELTFADTVFFTNSGVEAWECGVKLIRKHFYSKGQPEKNRIIVIEGAFHGRTMGAISASKAEKMVKGFGPLLEGFDQVAFGNLNELRAAVTPQTAAINIEPILGEGGIKAAPAEYLRALRQIADEFGLLLFFDEIQCGMGRTGKLFGPASRRTSCRSPRRSVAAFRWARAWRPRMPPAAWSPAPMARLMAAIRSPRRWASPRSMSSPSRPSWRTSRRRAKFCTRRWRASSPAIPGSSPRSAASG
jgi:acetylornithine/succinyldiaminopimelate/putrescine aminotransferase